MSWHRNWTFVGIQVGRHRSQYVGPHDISRGDIEKIKANLRLGFGFGCSLTRYFREWVGSFPLKQGNGSSRDYGGTSRWQSGRR